MLENLTDKQRMDVKIYKKLGGAVDTAKSREVFMQNMNERQYDGFQIHPFF